MEISNIPQYRNKEIIFNMSPIKLEEENGRYYGDIVQRLRFNKNDVEIGNYLINHKDKKLRKYYEYGYLDYHYIIKTRSKNSGVKYHYGKEIQEMEMFSLYNNKKFLLKKNIKEYKNRIKNLKNNPEKSFSQANIIRNKRLLEKAEKSLNTLIEDYNSYTGLVFYRLYSNDVIETITQETIIINEKILSYMENKNSIERNTFDLSVIRYIQKCFKYVNNCDSEEELISERCKNYLDMDGEVYLDYIRKELQPETKEDAIKRAYSRINSQ